MSRAVITAHADLSLALAEAEVLDWLEDLGLEVAFGEGSHLLAFADGDAAAAAEGLIAEVDFYPLDGGVATQVRWRLRQEGEPPLDDLLLQLRRFMAQSPHWTVDGALAEQPLPGGA
jgi:hypothetical protein